MGWLEANAVRSRSSWSGVNVRSGLYAVPFMAVDYVKSSRSCEVDELRCGRQRLTDVGDAKADGICGNCLEANPEDPTTGRLITDLKDLEGLMRQAAKNN